jgi:NAD(P)-dependent dehydrogenase (short-subunit alcohol dehydrogenase family)
MAVILVTGAGRGIGLALTRAYAERRDTVIAAVRGATDLSGLDAIPQPARKWISTLTMDVADPGDIARARRRLENEPIDVLINNAGIAGPDNQDALSMDYEGLQETLEINAIAPLRVANAFLPNIRSARGKIVTLSSQMGSMQSASSDALAYRVSKVASNRLMKGLASDLKPLGIPVLIVHPGWVRTAMGGPNAPLSAEESAAGLIRLIDGLTLTKTGKFLSWNGKELAW